MCRKEKKKKGKMMLYARVDVKSHSKHVSRILSCDESFGRYIEAFLNGEPVTPTNCQHVFFIRFKDATSLDRSRVLNKEFRAYCDFHKESVTLAIVELIDVADDVEPLPDSSQKISSSARVIVYGESVLQRVPVGSTATALDFNIPLSVAALVDYGIAVDKLGDASLSLHSGSITIGIHHDDPEHAKRVAEWILETPEIAEVCENVVMGATGQPLQYVTFLGHNSSNKLVDSARYVCNQGWFCAPPYKLNRPVSDASGKTMPALLKRVVRSLAPRELHVLKDDDLFILFTSSSLPFVAELAPGALEYLKNRDELQWTHNAPDNEWPPAVRKQMRGRLPALSTASWCVPHVKSHALLLLAARNQDVLRVAYAIVGDVIDRVPCNDLPTIEGNVRSQILFNPEIRVSSSDRYCCIMQDGGWPF
jgi:hypothetical protein